MTRWVLAALLLLGSSCDPIDSDRKKLMKGQRDGALARLSATDDPRAADAIRAVFHRTDLANYRDNAPFADALGKMATNDALSAATRDAATAGLVKSFDIYAGAPIKDAAALAIGEHKIEAAAPKLLEATLKGPGYWQEGKTVGNLIFRSSAAWALSTLGDTGAKTLLPALQREDLKPEVRDELVRALGATKSPLANDALLAAVDEPATREAALSALGASRSPQAVPVLLGAAQKNPNAVWWVLRAAADHGDPALAQPLVDAGALADWKLGPGAAANLRKLGWTPKSDQEQVLMAIAERKKDGGKALRSDFSRTRRVLRAEIESGKKQRVQNAVFALLGVGRAEALKDMTGVLRAAPKSSAGLEIANVYLVSGHPKLTSAAKAWAKKNGFGITKTSRSPDAVRWGSFN